MRIVLVCDSGHTRDMGIRIKLYELKDIVCHVCESTHLALLLTEGRTEQPSGHEKHHELKHINCWCHDDG